MNLEEELQHIKTEFANLQEKYRKVNTILIREIFIFNFATDVSLWLQCVMYNKSSLRAFVMKYNVVDRI